MKTIRFLFSSVIAMTLMMGGAVLNAQVPQGQDQQQEIQVSDSELESFANIMSKAQDAQNEAQMAIGKAIQNEPNLDRKRFQEIAQAQQQGNEVDMSPEEKKAYSAIQETIQKEQEKMDKKMASILKNNEMSQERYMEINQALRTDKELMNRFKNLMNKQQ